MRKIMAAIAAAAMMVAIGIGGHSIKIQCHSKNEIKVCEKHVR